MPSETAIANKPPALREQLDRRGIDDATWRALKHAVYAGATNESVLLVWDYCKAMRLDPLRKPVHIMTVDVKVAGTDRTEYREVPVPGIYLWRTVASRSGLYMGHSTPDYGPLIEVKGIKAPEWCAMTFYRHHVATGQRLEFAIKTFFREVVATTRDGKPNARWSRAPVQMLTKCCEAAGLRECCPDEFGGLQTFEELEGQRHPDVPQDPISEGMPALVAPANFDQWLDDLRAVADNGADAFAQAWKDAGDDLRQYLTVTDPDTYEQLKAKAAAVSAPASDESSD